MLYLSSIEYGSANFSLLILIRKALKKLHD
jgi:hypothetical protein